MSIGEGVGLVSLIRDFLLDRPSVRVAWRHVDHGKNTDRRMLASKEGRWVHATVHSTGRQPARIEAVGLELTDGSFVQLDRGDRLPKIVPRPEIIERQGQTDRIAESIRSRGAHVRAKAIRVNISPDRRTRQRLPPGWRDFPATDPPADPGSPEILMGWV